MNAGKPLPMALRENRVWGPKERLFERILPKASDAALARCCNRPTSVDGIVKGLKCPTGRKTAGRPCSGWRCSAAKSLQMNALNCR
jgi:DNA polymerase-3 subunit delta